MGQKPSCCTYVVVVSLALPGSGLYWATRAEHTVNGSLISIATDLARLVRCVCQKKSEFPLALLRLILHPWKKHKPRQ